MRFVRMPPAGEPRGLHRRPSWGSGRPTLGPVYRSLYPRDSTIALARCPNFETELMLVIIILPRHSGSM